MRYFTFCLSYEVFRICCACYSHTTSPLGPAAFQAPNSHMWLPATVLHSTDPDLWWESPEVLIKNAEPGGTSLTVQWLRLHASTAGGVGSIPGPGTKILHAKWCSQKKKKEKCRIWGLCLNFSSACLEWEPGIHIFNIYPADSYTVGLLTHCWASVINSRPLTHWREDRYLSAHSLSWNHVT